MALRLSTCSHTLHQTAPSHFHPLFHPWRLFLATRASVAQGGEERQLAACGGVAWSALGYLGALKCWQTVRLYLPPRDLALLDICGHIGLVVSVCHCLQSLGKVWLGNSAAPSTPRQPRLSPLRSPRSALCARSDCIQACAERRGIRYGRGHRSGIFTPTGVCLAVAGSDNRNLESGFSARSRTAPLRPTMKSWRAQAPGRDANVVSGR
ncbi:hypothetical protein B0T16DRAFT_90528 [Cercophora newfieldiana]|uniref:Uncharacterized protein n=1 Tax=Cercophora newfieldiana TaxID=92897 RepID=A0AA39YFZ8_9PEZI|nr:hypothetical protein B0T16DRAFT_90528 [Cercophora newfieldiana]